MLFLLFELGGKGYALDAAQIAEIVPFAQPRPVRGAPPQVAGCVAYRGDYLPVIDLAQLETGRASAQRMGTRIIVADVSWRGDRRSVAVILERVTEMLRCDPADFQPFAESPRGLVQRIDMDDLLAPYLSEGLFAATASAR